MIIRAAKYNRHVSPESHSNIILSTPKYGVKSGIYLVDTIKVDQEQNYGNITTLH